jgi:hypothetical protein
MSRYRICLFVAVFLLFAGGAIGYLVFSVGVRVAVRNTRAEKIRDVTVKVTGRSYVIGDLAPGISQTAKVSPTSESSVEVEFTDEQERRIRLNAGGYLEPGY